MNCGVTPRRPQPPQSNNCDDLELRIHSVTGERKYFHFEQPLGEWIKFDRIANKLVKKRINKKNVIVCGTGPQLLEVDLESAKKKKDASSSDATVRRFRSTPCYSIFSSVSTAGKTR
jgi:hypothetical protein